ncbi:MAG: hypothetical protein COB15_03300 [Flavobacteriales bacterium]|nr:MAG: hypothetical protein COB15_03300 [Flavobacteriales bacterium]
MNNLKIYLFIILILILKSNYFGQSTSKSLTASELIERGMQKSSRKEALKDFNLAIRIDSNNSEAYYYRSSFYYKGKDYTLEKSVRSTLMVSSLRDINHAIQINPNEDKYYLHKGRVLLIIDHLEDRGYTNEPLIMYSKAIAINKENSEALFSRGFHSMKMKKMVGACEDLYKSMELGHERGKSLYKMQCGKGKSYSDVAFGNWVRKEYKEAIENYTKAIELDPNYDVYYNSRAGVKADSKDFSGAMLDYKFAILLEKGNPDNYFSRGELKQELGDYRGAIKDFEKAIELKMDIGEYTDPHLSKGICYFSLSLRSNSETESKKLLDLAISIFTYSIKKSLYKGKHYYFRGLANLQLHKKEEGCLDLSKAGELGVVLAYDKIREVCN